MEDQLIQLKIKLQSLGALQPSAWQAILARKQEICLKTDERLIRKEGTLAYLAQGLLIEYDAQHRKKPAIINFIGAQQTIFTRSSNLHHYLKAVMDTTILYWELDSLQHLYSEFNELKKIFDGLYDAYDEGLSIRAFILELAVKDRISYFQQQYSKLIPFLKKKDIANYLHVSYTYLINNW
jgi:hypothetical protein